MKMLTTVALISTLALAATTTFATEVFNPKKHGLPTPKKGTMWLLCPKESTLVKDPSTKKWSAHKNQWRNYAKSFTTKITRFLGAQWSGIAVGQVICLYQGTPVGTFPIQLIFSSLTRQPTAGKWQSKKGHYYNCIASSQSSCPFLVELKKKELNPIDILKHFTPIKPEKTSP